MIEKNFLSKEEEKRLGLLAQAGDKEAFEKILNSNLRYAYKEAYKYVGLVRFSSDCDYEDLKQEAVYGLIEAINRCDFTRETSFRTFAAHWIKKYVYEAGLKAQGIAKIPGPIASKSLKYRQLTNNLNDEDIPSDEELIKLLKTNPNELENIKLATNQILKRATFLDDYSGDEVSQTKIIKNEGEGKSSEDTYFDDNYDLVFDMKCMEVLTDFEKQLVLDKFGFTNEENKEVSFVDLSKKYKIHYNTLRYRLARALEKMKKYYEEKGMSFEDFIVEIENKNNPED